MELVTLGHHEDKYPSLKWTRAGWHEGYTLDGNYGEEGNPFADANRIVPTDGKIECTFIEAESPEYSVATWSWEVAASRRQDGHYRIATGWQSLIPPPQMTPRFELTNGPATEDWPTTVVKVIHDQVPGEFVDDLTAYWLWMLEQADHIVDLSDERMKKARVAQNSSTRIVGSG